MTSKRILISGGRSPMALDLARNLKDSKHEIYIAETSRLHLCKFSNCIKKSFVVPSPRFSSKAHITALLNIIDQHKIDLFIPTWEDIYLVSKHLDLFPPSCKVLSSPFSLLKTVHNKWSFIEYLEALHIPAPKTILITSKEDLKKIPFAKFALKACYTRGSAKVFKIQQGEEFPDITPTEENAWVAQEWIEGKSYCAFSICHKGKVHAHTTYPAEFLLQRKRDSKQAVEGNCLTFRNIHHEGILKWVENFAAKSNFTGQIAFDFIEKEDGSLFTIECNPRMTNGVVLFTTADQLDQALFGENETLITPQKMVHKQIAVGMLLYGLYPAIRSSQGVHFIRNFRKFKDIVFHKKDIKPFFLLPLLWIKYVRDSRKYNTSIPAAFTYDLDFDA